jgi:uncharacterized protein (DUF1697 family)
MNPNDPLAKVPQGAYVLFNRLSEKCEGFTAQETVAASANLLLNALRQANPKQANALKAFDELMGRTKQVLSDHYNQFSGERNNIFPFDQVVQMNLAKFPTTWPT